MPDTTGLHLTHQSVTLECIGYPLSTWLEITYTDRNNAAEITQVDQYADEAKTVLHVDGLTREDFTDEQWRDLNAALDTALVSLEDRRRLDVQLDKLQRSLCGFGFRTERWS